MDVTGTAPKARDYILEAEMEGLPCGLPEKRPRVKASRPREKRKPSVCVRKDRG
jgi:hypothetical protein